MKESSFNKESLKYRIFLEKFLNTRGQELFLLSAIALGEQDIEEMSNETTTHMYTLAEQNSTNKAIKHPVLVDIASIFKVPQPNSKRKMSQSGEAESVTTYADRATWKLLIFSDIPEREPLIFLGTFTKQ
jgi:hypothetical protein